MNGGLSESVLDADEQLNAVVKRREEAAERLSKWLDEKYPLVPAVTIVPPRFVVSIAGIIGAGKSELAKQLAPVLNLPLYVEDVIDHEYLERFYRDMKRHAFGLQIHLINKRFRQAQLITWSGKGAVQDRTFYEDEVFARMLQQDGLMEAHEFRDYVELAETMKNYIQHPNLIVFLDVKPETALERIRRRNRAWERISLEYLTKLYEAYKVFIADIAKKIPVIVVNWESFEDASIVADKVVRKYLTEIAKPHQLEGHGGRANQ